MDFKGLQGEYLAKGKEKYRLIRGFKGDNRFASAGNCANRNLPAQISEASLGRFRVATVQQKVSCLPMSITLNTCGQAGE